MFLDPCLMVRAHNYISHIWSVCMDDVTKWWNVTSCSPNDSVHIYPCLIHVSCIFPQRCMSTCVGIDCGLTVVWNICYVLLYISSSLLQISFSICSKSPIPHHCIEGRLASSEHLDLLPAGKVYTLLPWLISKDCWLVYRYWFVSKDC